MDNDLFDCFGRQSVFLDGVEHGLVQFRDVDRQRVRARGVPKVRVTDGLRHPLALAAARLDHETSAALLRTACRKSRE